MNWQACFFSVSSPTNTLPFPPKIPKWHRRLDHTPAPALSPWSLSLCDCCVLSNEWKFLDLALMPSIDFVSSHWMVVLFSILVGSVLNCRNHVLTGRPCLRFHFRSRLRKPEAQVSEGTWKSYFAFLSVLALNALCLAKLKYL